MKRQVVWMVAGGLLCGSPAVVMAQGNAPEGRALQPGSFRGSITDLNLRSATPTLEINDRKGNTQRVQLDPNRTEIIRQGEKVEPEALKIGQLVEVKHRGDGAPAESIEILQGPDRAGRAEEDLRLGDEARTPGETRVVAGKAGSALEPIGSYRPGDKLVRGLANLFGGLIEIPRNIYNTTHEENMLTGWTVGLAKGLGYTVLRMGSGIYEMVTFPFPVPKNYAPIIEPEFPWDAQGPAVI